MSKEIAEISSVFVYNLDNTNLSKTLKSVISQNQGINGITIRDEISGELIFSYFLQDNTPIFNHPIPLSITKSSVRSESKIVFDSMLIGYARVYMAPIKNNLPVRFSIWYFAVIFILTLLFLNIIFRVISKYSNSESSAIAFGSRKFSSLVLLSITVFIIMASIGGWVVVNNNEKYTIKKTEQSLKSIIYALDKRIEEKKNIIGTTYHHILSSDRFQAAYKSMVKHRHSQTSAPFLKAKHEMATLLNEYSDLHIGTIDSFSLYMKNGATILENGNSLSYKEAKEDIYIPFLEAISGRDSIFPLQAKYDLKNHIYTGHLFFSAPVFDKEDKEVIGIMFNEIFTDEFFFPDSYNRHFEGTGEIIVANKNGEMLSRCRTEPCQSDNNNRKSLISHIINKDGVSNIKFIQDYRGKDVFAISHWKKGFQVGFIAKIDVEEVFHEHYQFENGVIIIILAMSAFTIIAVSYTLNIGKKAHDKLLDANRSIIERLGNAAEFKDNDTGMHVIRMSHYSRVIAKNAGCDEQWCETLFTSAPMHDIGKIGVPDSILQKPGKLTSQEWEIMKEHPIFGAKIIGRHNSELLTMAREISIAHHEKWDGSGYPYGLIGKDIPLSARIIAIADVYDALTSERPYKKAWTEEKAIALIESESGKHFDPVLVSVFLESINELSEVKRSYKDTLTH